MRTRVRATERYKQMSCRVCSKPVTVGRNTQKAPRCIDCGVDAYVASRMEIARGAGPNFDRWLAGCQAKSATDQGGEGVAGQ